MNSRKLILDVQSLEGMLRTACILEAAARKAGNVHPGAGFADLCFSDFARAAEVTAPVMACAATYGVGRTILQAVAETNRHVGTNVNLGIILLLVPLAAVPAGVACREGLPHVLDSLNMTDAEQILQAIRTARPGGLGSVPEADVVEPPQRPIVEIMALAADRDLVARQYASGFDDILNFGQRTFHEWLTSAGDWETVVVGTHLSLVAASGDSLISRKCGPEVAESARQRAQHVLDAGWPNGARAARAFRDFDHWLRQDGHRRNPGTTADLIAAILFSVIRDREWRPPEAILLHGSDSFP